MCHIELSHVMQLLCLQSQGSAWATAVAVWRGIGGIVLMVPECVK